MKIEPTAAQDATPPSLWTRADAGEMPSDLNAWFISHDHLSIVAWRDPAVEISGHHPASAYVERYWLPSFGPSATWAQRRLVFALEDHGGSYRISLVDLARELGLGAGTGRHSLVVRTLTRLVALGLARPSEELLAVRLAVPSLSARHLARLPDHLARLHQQERLASFVAGGGRRSPRASGACGKTRAETPAPGRDDDCRLPG